MLKNRGAENSCVLLPATRGSSAHQLNGLLSVGRASPHAGDADVCRHYRTLLNSWNKIPIGSLWVSDLRLLSDVPRGEKEHWISFHRATAQPQHLGTSKASQGFLCVCDSSLGIPVPKLPALSYHMYSKQENHWGKVPFPDASPSTDVNFKGVFFPPCSDTVSVQECYRHYLEFLAAFSVPDLCTWLLLVTSGMSTMHRGSTNHLVERENLSNSDGEIR